MAMKFLGETLDIHCGGVDHIRVHHTNEIAQSYCATGKPFSKYWVHGGWLLESKEDGSGGKMSKSKDEFIRLSTLTEREFHPLDYRYFCGTAHYRNYLTFSWANLQSAKDSLNRLRERTLPLVRQAGSICSQGAQEWLCRFMQGLCDDLNIPQALGIFNLMLKDPDILPGEKGALILEFDKILGFDLARNARSSSEPKALPEELQSLIHQRNKARKAKNFKRADEIRNIFKQHGYILKDSPGGTTWERHP
jgi:cysteinyl-tRNA synthetase